jgi:legumain
MYSLSWPQAMVGAWEGQCGQLDQYGMQHTRTFANLCNAGVPVDTLADAAAIACAPTPVPTS